MPDMVNIIRNLYLAFLRLGAVQAPEMSSLDHHLTGD
jgi:hypothetical protein